MNYENIKNEADVYIEKHMNQLWEISEFIHANPELAFQEEKAANKLCSFLQKFGFDVEKGIGDLPTAFKATYKNLKDGPKIAILAEYDALPNLGHACGHNLISASALGAAIGLKKFMLDSNIAGTLEIIGTPAEEDGGGKILLLEKGVFKDVDAVFLLHPTSGITRIAGECMSSHEFEIEYEGVSAHAGSHPEDGINALDAANLFYSGIGLLRQQMKKSTNITCIFKSGGATTSLIPNYASLLCNAYSFNYKDLQVIVEKIKNCANGMSVAMGTRIKILEHQGYAGRIPNEVLGNVMKQELAKLNEPVMNGMPLDYGGEDLGNISRHIPICNLYVTIFDKYKISNHTPQFRELSISEAGYRCVSIGAKAMARAGAELFIYPQNILDAKCELKERLACE